MWLNTRHLAATCRPAPGLINLSAEHVALTVLPLDLRGQRRNCFTYTGLVLVPVKPPELHFCQRTTACHRRLHLTHHNALLKRSVRTIPINPSLTWDSPIRNFNNLSCPRINYSAHKATVLLHDFLRNVRSSAQHSASSLLRACFRGTSRFAP